jgi:hypothetical protein
LIVVYGFDLDHENAKRRRQDMLAEAERWNLLEQDRVSRPPRSGIAGAVSALRQRVGRVLIEAGERIRGVGAETDGVGRWPADRPTDGDRGVRRTPPGAMGRDARLAREPGKRFVGDKLFDEPVRREWCGGSSD